MKGSRYSVNPSLAFYSHVSFSTACLLFPWNNFILNVCSRENYFCHFGWWFFFSFQRSTSELILVEDEATDTEDNEEEDLGVMEDQRSVILHLISQLKLGMDLTRVWAQYLFPNVFLCVCVRAWPNRQRCLPLHKRVVLDSCGLLLSARQVFTWKTLLGGKKRI